VEPLPIVQAGAPVLRARAVQVPVAEIVTPRFQALIAGMVATMRAAPGVGLAAPQIGLPFRVFVAEDSEERQAAQTESDRRERGREPLPLRVFVNPVLRVVGDERATFFEGCLSVDGYTALVERSLEVEVTGLDEHGAPARLQARGWPARILQHEIDHLDGVLYVDRMLTRSFATVDQAKSLYAGKSIAEVRQLLGV
jgi:peptide deformylase